MSLALALNTALSGLNVNQRALAVLSQNIANANTAGYSRKILNQQSVYLNGNGAGASIDNITRRVDEYLINTMRLQNSVAGRTSAANTYADRTQLLLGAPGAGNSINNYVTNFFGGLQSLAQAPEDITFQSNAINNAVTLTQQIGKLAQNLQELRYQADQDLSTAVTIINSNLKRIFTLNAAITQNQAQGQPVTELLDKRDQALADISQYLDVQTFTRDNGAINLSVNGISLLDDTLFQISYSTVTSVDQLTNNGALSPMQIYRTDESGNFVGSPVTLVTGGTSAQVVSVVTSGRVKALLDQRDHVLPNMLAQLDVFATSLRDRFNAIHNAGTGFPGANSYTGTRAVFASDYSQWNGSMRLAVLGSDGRPISAAYSNMPGGMPPLLLNLSTLNTGNGAGKPSAQGIVNEINQYFGIPQNKVQVGNISNIRLGSLTSSLPGSPPQFSFNLDLENLSTADANVFVTGVTVLDSDGIDMTSITENAPSIAIAAANGFVTTQDSPTITINTASSHGLQNGDTIYLPDIAAAVAPAMDLNGIPFSELSGQSFTISNVTATSFEITVTSDASANGAVASVGATLLPPYAAVEAGTSGRAANPITASLSTNSTSPFYTVKVNVAVVDEEGVLRTSEVTYRVTNSQSNLLNNRYAAQAATDDGELMTPTSTQAIARAMLVDADGRELPKVNGQYITSQQGFLKIVANNSSYAIAIDSMDSAEQGNPDANPPTSGTGRGFSYYFNLNDFFLSNGNDATAGSALNLQVMQRLIDNPNLISLGGLEAVAAAADGTPSYTYHRAIGDNSFIRQLADLGLSPVAFAAAGGLSNTTQTFSGYASQIITAASLSAASAKSEDINAQTLLEGYIASGSTISGVNLDEELANTVVYQNAYTASARVITVANSLFQALLDTF